MIGNCIVIMLLKHGSVLKKCVSPYFLSLYKQKNIIKKNKTYTFANFRNYF